MEKQDFESHIKQENKQCKKGVYERYLKRFFDFICALLALIILSPVILVIAILVRYKLGAPVIFSQERPGLHERLFKLYKFRSMTDEKDEKGELLPDQDRITKFGHFLRKTSLDELPELWNILRGDMSIVGPRPLLVRYLPYYDEYERRRHNVRPGLTGEAQIHGRNALSWSERFKMDVEYTQHVTLVKDIKIIFSTIGKVLKQDDILVGKEHILKDLDVERKQWIKSED